MGPHRRNHGKLPPVPPMISPAKYSLLAGLFLAFPAQAAGLADCPRAFDTREVTDAADSAERAFTGVDVEAFLPARAEMQARLACVKELLSPAALARVHRVEALGAFVEGNQAKVPQALAGVFAAEPGHQVPTSLLPEGHPVRGQVPVAMLALRDDLGEPLPPLVSGWIEADGVGAERAPAQRAAVLQQVDNQGQAIATHYHWPGDTNATWLVPVEGAAPTKVADTRQVSRAAVDVGDTGQSASSKSATPSPWAHRAPWLATAGASVIASGVMLALAADGRAEFDATEPLSASASSDERSALRSELSADQDRVNALVYAGYAAAGVGLGLGAVAVFTW